MNLINIKDFDLNLLNFFSSIFEEGSISKAAKRMNLTQSAVSHGLKRLRSHFEDPLFIRTKSGVEPSARALDLYPKIKSSLEEIDRYLSSRQSFDPASSDRLFKISMSDYVEKVLLTPLILKLQAEAPNVDIEISNLPTSSTQEGLENGSFELVIGNREVSSSVKKKFLFEDHYISFVKSNHPEIQDSLSLDLFLKFPHILFSPRGRKIGPIDEMLEERKLKRRIALRVPHLSDIPHIIENTNFIVTLPSRLKSTVLASKRLKEFQLPVELEALQVFQYWHEKYELEPGNRWLRSVIESLLM